MPRTSIRVVPQERKPVTVRMTRVLARLLGAYVPGIQLFGQIRRGANNLKTFIVTPVMWPGSELPDGGAALAWDVREDDEGDIKRKDKEAA